MGKKGPEDAFVPVEVNVQDPRTLIVALKSPEPLVAGKAARSLEKFANLSAKNKKDLVHLGILEAATPLLSHEDLELKAQVAGMLATLAESEVARKEIKKHNLKGPHNCTMPMVKLLTEEEGLISNENASGYLAQFATEYSGRVQIFEAGGLDGLIQLLVRMVPDPADAKAVKAAPQVPDLLRNTLQALWLLCDDFDARAALGKDDTGGIETLLVILDSEYNELQSLALKCLLAATKIMRNRMIVRVSGGLIKLLNYVAKEEFQPTHAQALDVLARLLHEPEAMKAVSERTPGDKKNPAGFPAPIEQLSTFVKVPDATTSIAALRCVSSAGNNPANRRVLSSVNVEASVADKLWSSNPKDPLNPGVGLAAIEAVTVLCQSDVCSANLGSSGAIPKLINLLTWESNDCIVAAGRALAAVTLAVEDNRVMFVDAEGVTKVCGLFESDDPEKWCSAANVLYNIADSFKTRSAVTGVDLLPGLLKCVQSSTQDPIFAGLQLLTSLSRDVAFRETLTSNHDVVTAILKLSQHEEFDVKLAAWRAVRACAANRQLALAMCSLGAIDVFSSQSNKFAKAAFNQLCEWDLSAKYAFYGRLDVTNIICGTFYDTGSVAFGDKFRSIEDLKQVSPSTARETVVVEFTSDAEGSATINKTLAEFVETCKVKIGSNASVADIAKAVAIAVSDRMGGAVPLKSFADFSHQLATMELKLEQGSSAVPIEKITKGTHYHRALMFKVVGDQLGLLSTLVRGDYGRAYNVIHDPEMAVVDVMHEPGVMYKLSPHTSDVSDVGDLQLPGLFYEYASDKDRIAIG